MKRKVDKKRFASITSHLGYEGKKKLIKDQLTALTKLKRAYTKGESLPDCPLCATLETNCFYCIWHLMNGYVCGFGWGELLEKHVDDEDDIVSLEAFREGYSRVETFVAARLAYLEEQRKELRSLLAYVEREEERRIKEWLSKSL